MKLKLFCLFTFLLSIGFAYNQTANPLAITTIYLDHDTTIKFPLVNNCSSSNRINTTLYDLLQSFFPCQNEKNTMDCLEKAASIDLYKSDFSSFSTDSTVSFIINIVLKKHNVSHSFKNLLTFSLKTGKRLTIKDVFPEFSDVDFYNFFLHYNAFNYKPNIHKHLKELLVNKVISENELKIVRNRLQYNECQEYFTEFVLTGGRLLFKSSYIIPDEMVKFLPDVLIIGVDDFKSQLLLNENQLK